MEQDNLKIGCILLFFVIILIFLSLMTNNNISTNHNIYISLTTIPERLVHPVFYEDILNLLSLDGEYIVILNIPYIYKRTGEEYIIPDNIKLLQGPKLIINRVKEDYGPLTKL